MPDIADIACLNCRPCRFPRAGRGNPRPGKHSFDLFDKRVLIKKFLFAINGSLAIGDRIRNPTDMVSGDGSASMFDPLVFGRRREKQK